MCIRDRHSTHHEQVSITASARIPSSQNHNLRERTRLASREGLTLSQPNVNYSLPVSQVNRVVHELRGEIEFGIGAVSYTHLRAHETVLDLVCRLLLEKKKQKQLLVFFCLES